MDDTKKHSRKWLKHWKQEQVKTLWYLDLTKNVDKMDFQQNEETIKRQFKVQEYLRENYLRLRNGDPNPNKLLAIAKKVLG